MRLILDFSEETYESVIRSNAVLALSLLTYHESMFELLEKNRVIDKVMNLCKAQSSDADIKVKQFSTLALVHFALNKKSLDILIKKNVMNLFNSFSTINNKTI